MKKLLTERELIDFIKRIITEAAPKDLGGRSYEIMGDGTVKIMNNRNQPIVIRLSSSLGDINVAKIDQLQDGYRVFGKKGMSKDIDHSVVSQIISFVDTGKPNKISKGLISLYLNKV